MKVSRTFGICIIAMSIILSLIFLSWWGIDHYIEDPNERGTFGDKFGAVNSLFSGLAFAGLILTIYLQQKELSLQREELRQTREEMNRQTKEFDEQNKILKIQRFENTFFSMIGLLQEITQGLSITTNMQVFHKRRDESGRISRIFEDELTTIQGKQVFMTTYKDADIRLADLIKTKGIKGYNENDSITMFDHYFRYLYRIMKYVDSSHLIVDFNERYQYMAMLRAQLSKYELIWLYYNGLSDSGKEKLKPLIEKYSMLKNLRRDLIVETDQPVGNYQPSAF